jgi:hypothetical protein
VGSSGWSGPDFRLLPMSRARRIQIQVFMVPARTNPTRKAQFASSTNAVGRHVGLQAVEDPPVRSERTEQGRQAVRKERSPSYVMYVPVA